MLKTPTSKKDRYPGIRSFEAEDERLFYGRSKEIDDLFSLVKIKPLVVLFGKSGLGKSSLLKAGLGFVLLENHFFPIMIRVQDTKVSPIATVLSELEPFVDQKKLTQFGGKSSNQIWECINACSFTDSNGNRATPVLIFDQFEELFNHEKAEQSEWARQLSDLIEGRRPKDVVEAFQQIPFRQRTPEQLAWFEPPAVKILFAIRSDRMSELHQLRYQIPAILQHRYELKPLQSAASSEAIEKPAALIGAQFTTLPFTYAAETVQEIQNNLSNEADEIESFQLQIVCQHIEEKIKAQQSEGKQNIVATSDFLGGKGGIQDILKNYYDNHIKNLGSQEDQVAARKLLEEGLIADGRRIGVADAVVKGTFAIHDDLLGKLLESRLIRPENTRLGRTYEISHDTLVAPILEAYEKRRLEEERISKQKELEERERQLAIERRKRRISTLITIGAVVLSLLAIGASFFAWNQQKKAVISERNAKDRERQAITSDSLAQIKTKEAIYSDSISKLNLKIALEADSLTKLALSAAETQKGIAIQEKQKAVLAKAEAETQKEKADSSNALSQKIIDAFYFYGDSLALASKRDGDKIFYGFINKKGETIIDYQYEEALPFDDKTGYARVTKYGKKYLLGPDKKEYLLTNRIEELTPNITALDIRGQSLAQLPDTVFQFPQLQILLLDQNSLKTLPPEFGNLVKLQSLGLSHNQLDSLPPEIGNLVKLQDLRLGSNRLQILPPEVGNLVNLQDLDLSYNLLESLPPEFGNLVNLQDLYLRRAGLISLPPEFGNLVKLQSLYLGYVRLKSLPPEIGSLVNLQDLNLRSARLRNLPPEIGSLVNLQSLDLSHNRLESLPPEFGNLVKLQSLDLFNAGLRNLPSEFGNLVNLQSLDLSHNQLDSLSPEIGNLVNLYSLYLDKTKLKSLPPEFGNLVKLQSLDLNSNLLKSLPPEFGNLVNLQSLDLRYSNLTSLPPEFGNLVDLQSLDLYGNDLVSLPSEIGNLVNLQSLDLSGSNLASLPLEIGNLVNLQSLDFYYNPLSEEEKQKIKKLLPNCKINN